MNDKTNGENPNGGELGGEHGTTRRSLMKGIGAAGAASVAGGTAFSGGAAAYQPVDGVPYADDFVKLCTPSISGYATNQYVTSDDWRPFIELLTSQDDPRPDVTTMSVSEAVADQEQVVGNLQKTVQSAVFSENISLTKSEGNLVLGIDSDTSPRIGVRTAVVDTIADSYAEGQSKSQAVTNAKDELKQYLKGFEKRSLNIWNAFAYVQWMYTHQMWKVVSTNTDATQTDFVTQTSDVFDLTLYDDFAPDSTDNMSVLDMAPVGEYVLRDGSTMDVLPLISNNSSDGIGFVSPVQNDINTYSEVRSDPLHVTWYHLGDEYNEPSQSDSIYQLQQALLLNPTSEQNTTGTLDGGVLSSSVSSVSDVHLEGADQSVTDVLALRPMMDEMNKFVNNFVSNTVGNIADKVYNDLSSDFYAASDLMVDFAVDGTTDVAQMDAMDSVLGGYGWNPEPVETTVERINGSGSTVDATQTVTGELSLRFKEPVVEAMLDTNDTPTLPGDNGVLQHIRDNLSGETQMDVTVYINYADGSGNSSKQAKYTTSSNVGPSNTYGLGFGVSNNIVTAPDGVTDLVSDVSQVNFAYIRIDSVNVDGVMPKMRLKPGDVVEIEPDYEFGDSLGGTTDYMAYAGSVVGYQNGEMVDVTLRPGDRVTVDTINNVEGTGTLNYLTYPVWLGGTDVSRYVDHRSLATADIDTLLSNIMSHYSDLTIGGTMSSINGTVSSGGLLGGALGGSGGSGGGDVGSSVDRAIGLIAGGGLLSTLVFWAAKSMNSDEDATEYR